MFNGFPLQQDPLQALPQTPNIGFPGIVPPQGFSTGSSDFPVEAQVASPTPVAGPQPNEVGFFENLKSTPEGQAALMQMIGGLLQPVGAGNGAGVLGASLGGAAENFIKNTGASEDRQIKRNTVNEGQRQDKESNPTEESKISLDRALESYYAKTGAAAGAKAGKIEPWNDAGFVANWQKTKGFATLAEAEANVWEYHVTNGLVDPAIAQRELLNKIGGNTVFDAAGQEDALGVTRAITEGGTTPIPANVTAAHIKEALSGPNREQVLQTYGKDALLDLLLQAN